MIMQQASIFLQLTIRTVSLNNDKFLRRFPFPQFRVNFSDHGSVQGIECLGTVQRNDTLATDSSNMTSFSSELLAWAAGCPARSGWQVETSLQFLAIGASPDFPYQFEICQTKRHRLFMI